MMKEEDSKNPRRIYLDAQFSDEEDGQEEAKKKEEESRRTDKLLYTPEELDELVKSVIDMTTLSGLEEADWSDLCISEIREFFCRPETPVLSLYFWGESLVAERAFPTAALHEFNYFIRRPGEIFRHDQFRENVLFGTINLEAEKYILGLISNVLTPIFFKLEAWPDTDFYSVLDEFLCKLTDLTHKMSGLTVLYVPAQGSDLSIDEACADKELLKRLEGVMVHWSTQLKITLSDQDQSTPSELLRLEDEYDFWLYRYDNLSGIAHQLKNPEIRHILEILTAASSTYLRQFLQLEAEIRRRIEETKSNIVYLGILKEPCAELNACSTPSCMTDRLPRIIHLFRTVWLNSPYYNTRERMTNLFGALSSQVIHICRKYIDLRDVFSGKTRKSLAKIEECIEACRNYKALYNRFADAHNALTSHPWDLDSEKIFRYVNAFIGRCQDVMDICLAMIHFARLDENEKIDRPRFGGKSGEMHEWECRKMEKLFRESLRRMRRCAGKMLDVQETDWHEDIFDFRQDVIELETLVKNLANDVYAKVTEVQEALESLWAFYNYAKRPTLRVLFDDKAALLWKMYSDEVQSTKEVILERKEEYPALTSFYAGRALLLRLKGDRLRATRKILDDAEWLSHGALTEEIHHQLEILAKTVHEFIQDLYYSWIKECGDNPRRHLDRFLMRRGEKLTNVQLQLIECNIDPIILNVCHEAVHWQNLDFHLPVNIRIICDKRESLHFIYERVLGVVCAYNRIVQALSPFERSLFRELIKDLDRKIAPGIEELKWNAEYMDQYIVECFERTQNLLEFLDTYKRSNMEIMQACEGISDFSLIKIQPSHAYELTEFQQELMDVRNATVQQILQQCDMIVQFVMVIYEGFRRVIKESLKEWQVYLMNLDVLLEDALRVCLKNSINNLYGALRGDDSTAPSALLLVRAYLVDKKIIFDPSLTTIGSLLRNVRNFLLDPMKSIERLEKKFGFLGKEGSSFWDICEADDELLQVQRSIDFEISQCSNDIQTYVRSWDFYKDAWEGNIELFLQRYEKRKPTVKSFNVDIGKYQELMQHAESQQESIEAVHFLFINSENLKFAIIKLCSNWIDGLISLLLKLTEGKIDRIYRYIADNSRKITKEPTNLESMQQALRLLDKLTADVPKEEQEFPIIQEQFQALGKYEVPLTFEFKRRLNDIDRSWAAYLELLDIYKIILLEKKEEFRRMLLQEANTFAEDVSSLLRKFIDTGPFTSDWFAKDALVWLMFFRKEMENLRERQRQLQRQLMIFGSNQPDSLDLVRLEKDVTAIEVVWQLTDEWDESWERYKTSNFWTIEMGEMDENANVLFRKLTRLSRELQEKKWEIVEHTRSRLDKFRRTLPLITDLKNAAMRPRHWAKVKELIGHDFDQTSENFTLDAIIEMEMQIYAEDINETSNTATMELAIEQALEHITSTWGKILLDMTPHKDRGIFRLKSVDDIMQTLEDDQVHLSSMKATRYVEPFAEEVDYWERSLSLAGEVIETVLAVQRSHMYMDNIFTTDDIRKQLPRETEEFEKLTDEWARVTSRMAKHAFVLRASQDPPDLLATLNKIYGKLEALQRALEEYLETKRRVFPRFYFISNEDLIEVLANSKKPELIQPYIKKLFENIKSLKLGKTLGGKLSAEGMISPEGEFVEFTKLVLLEGQVESWLCDVETAMRETLRELLKRCRGALKKMLAKRDAWAKAWPSQSAITSTQIQWTTDCTRTLIYCKMSESKKPLKKLRKRLNQALIKYSEAIRGELSKLQRLNFKSIIVIEIHARDVVEKMYRNDCRDVSSFDWLSQLRFYWEKEIDDCHIRQTNTHFLYGYEYLGNTGRLVITPLTDRCYITLTTALHLFRGGSPKGPAGTGKTETVKDLGKALGYNVIVQNCSEGLDYKSMGKMFSGLAQTGAWGCFDEFNRINVEVLSVVAQQILSILSALAQRLKVFTFEGSAIPLVPTCGIFITMNPGYAGRTELPDNLKSMFRPISMMVPDSGMIAEINLFGEGFQDTRTLSRKIFTLYTLAQQQLSKQYHYDFGLRGIVTLTRYAGKKKRIHPSLPEEEVIILAMKDMNIAKLTSDDLPLFLGITGDLFPNVEVPTVDYEEIISYLTKEAKKLKLQPIPLILRKVIELFETKNSRHSSMIVGESNTAKTVTWRMLQNVLTAMKHDGKKAFNKVHVYPINPKALDLAELYGEYNLTTGEWHDGVISSIMRKTCAEDTPDEKWILFDGPVDAVWIENMNSVMDDNKVLTLINNDRITMPEQVSLLFEVEDLAVASPATVSRAGMIYNDYKDLGWQPYVESWLNDYSNAPEFLQEMRELFERFVDVTLKFKREKCVEPVPVPELNAVQSLCKLIQVYVSSVNGLALNDAKDDFSGMCKLWFLFCMIWSVCASVDEEGRQKMDSFVREMDGSFPLRNMIYDYYVDTRQRTFVSWEEKLSHLWKFQSGIPFHKIIVPTVDTMRYEYIVSNLLATGYPVLLVGPVGTGKTSTAQAVLESIDPTKYAFLVVNMSAQTTSRNVQEAIESRLEKRTKGVFVPSSGKTMITFMDDFNMPMKETYGSQPPLELIRQWIGYKFWYDREKQTRKYVERMQLMVAMGPPGGGRNSITNRLLTKFNLINMTFPTEKQILRIYSMMLTQHLTEFHAEVKGLVSEITQASVDLYNNVNLKMLPTPSKMHYLFNLRDISKVFQGLLRSHKDYQYSRQTFLRLWIHEAFRVFSDRLIDERDRGWFVEKLNDLLGKHFEVTFHNVCPEKRSPVFGSFMNPWDVYVDLTDIDAVRDYLEEQIDEYNASPGVIHLQLILFRDAIEHLCRILRVISQPCGNPLLVGTGGNGRQSLSRIAIYMCEQTLYEIAVTGQYKVAEFREDLKTLYLLAGVENKPTTFLLSDSQIVEEEFLEIVNNVLSTGEVPNLFKAEDMENIKNKLSKDAVKSGRQPTTEAIYGFLIERVQLGMHLILCMSPIGEAFRNRLRQYPALINSMTIDWYLEWPLEALLEVANKFLENLDLTLTITGENRIEERRSVSALPPLQERMLRGVASSFASIHSTVSLFTRRMAIEMKRYNYVTPTNFIELVTGYKRMIAMKRRELSEEAAKLRNGLAKIDETKEKVNEMAAELEITQQQVEASTKECEEYLLIIVNQRHDADETQKMVVARSRRIVEEQKECKKLEEIARADLATVEPALEEAMKALDALNKKDLAEIKSFARPPPKVEMVMEAVMILKKSEPSWAESKRQLGDVNFINTLRDFDKDHISEKTLKTISKYTSNPEFDPVKVGVVSIAAKSLAMWVIAMEQYAKLYRVVAPKRERLEAALASLAQKEAALAEATEQLHKLREELDRLQQLYDAKMKEKEDLIKLAEALKIKLERAGMLLDGLSGERVRWKNTAENFAEYFDRLPGDCLVSTAFVSYLGPFVSKYRGEMLAIWLREVEEREIPLSEDLQLKEFLSDPTTIREWNIQGLPSDDFSTENGIIVAHGTRWPLVIDPQCQAVKWIKNMEAKNSLKVIDFGQTDFAKILEVAIQSGRPVLLQNVGESLDPLLKPVLQKALIKSGGQIMINFNDKLITYNENFRLFITTKLPNPHYPPEISTKTTLCNFAIKEEGLEAQLLGIVVRREKPQLEEQKDKLVLTIASGKRTLRELEDRILRLLSVASGSILDDLDLIDALQTSKVTSKSVEESLLISEETEKEIDLAREEYRACSKRASVLFFALNDMSFVDPMYQHSLDAYIALYGMSIEKSGRSVDLSERIENINDYHTYALYRNACRSLFERHKLVFSFHLCVKVLDADGKIHGPQYAFLLSGGIVLDRANQPDKPVPWLSDEAWDNISELDKLPGFHGIAASFEQFPRDWHNWYIQTEPETTALAAEWEERCNDFQKMLVVRCCRPDRISFCIASFIARNLGERFIEPPVLDLKSVLDDSIAQTPLIFVLSPGVDPTSSLMLLVESQQMSEHFATLSLGQGQAPIATKLIEIGAREGLWVFLANCHLSLSWMPKLDKIVENLANDKNLHPRFRLWLSSNPTVDFPISILQAAIKMTTEPPKGLKANMKRLYSLITDVQFELCEAKAKYKKLLFALVFFHSVLLERKKFQQLGWNVLYSFNDSDFEVSENILRVYLDEYPETPWDSLKYLIAGICYGGHVTDEWDRRVLMTYVQQYFNEQTLQVPHYRLSSLPVYYVPRDGSLETYRDFIAMLPNTDRPEAFGQHPNADIICLIIEARAMFETLMSLQVQIVSGDHETDKEGKVTRLAHDILSQLPKSIDYETTEKLMGPRKGPLDVVLLQEIVRYNALLAKTRGNLEELMMAIEGLVVMSSELEEIFSCIYEGRVPSFWLTAYPSLKLLGSWTRDLTSRVEHFTSWATTLHQPLFFWLAAYTFPTAFLTAVLQIYARTWNVAIDSLSWEFIVFTSNEAAVNEPPADGVYIRTIYLEGADWNKRNGTLAEPAPMQLICEMPAIHFKPVEQLRKKIKGFYSCPCYYYPQRSGDQGRASFVVAVDLKSGQEEPDFWTKRSTALLLSLAT